jgi:hypothetical protein
MSAAAKFKSSGIHTECRCQTPMGSFLTVIRA